MEQHKLVSPEEWLDARIKLLRKETELTRQRDAISAERRALPWVTIEKKYAFDAPEGRVTPFRPLRGAQPAQPDRTEVTVPGVHFIQEDSGKQIGQAIATWLDTLA